MADMGDDDWDEVDASNTATVPDGWPEGQNPSTVNNCARAMMGALKRWWNRGNATATTGGTTTAYTLTYDQAASAYYDGEMFEFVVDQACGATPTLNVNSLGARSLKKYVGTWVTLSSGDLTASQVVRVRYDLATTSFWIVAGQSSIPTGTITEFAGSTAPSGWLLCDGSAIDRTDFAGLFAVCSTTYGAGDGSTTFNVPDHDNRFVRGNGTSGATGGADTHNHTLSGNVPGFTFGSLSVSVTGTTGTSSNNVTMQNGSTSVASAGHTHSVTSTGSATGSLSTSTNLATGVVGSASSLPAYIQQKKIIKT